MMDDPKSAADCLAHCRLALSDYAYRYALSQIEAYAHMQRLAGVYELRDAYNRIFDAPITAAEVAQAEEPT